MGNDDVIVLGGNSPAFHSIVISLTVFLAALIGAVLLYELAMFLYQRVTTKNRTEDIGSGGGNNIPPRVLHAPFSNSLVFAIHMLQ